MWLSTERAPKTQTSVEATIFGLEKIKQNKANTPGLFTLTAFNFS